MKLDFKRARRKLFGSSPGKKKRKIGNSRSRVSKSGTTRKLEKAVSIMLVIFMSMSLVSLIGPSSFFDFDFGNKKTTTASTTAPPDENSVLGLKIFNNELMPSTIEPKGDVLIEVEKQYFDINASFALGEFIGYAKQIVICCMNNNGTPLITHFGYVGDVYYQGELQAEGIEAFVYNFANSFVDANVWCVDDFAQFGATQEDLQKINILEEPKDEVIASWLNANTKPFETEDVFGLRKLKENYTPITISSEYLYDNDESQIIFDYGFAVIVNIQGVDFEVVITCPLTDKYDTFMLQETFGEYTWASITEQSFVDFIGNFIANGFYIKYTQNPTVDEWLLANTEPVADSITLKAGTYRFNDVLGGFPEIDLGNPYDCYIPISFNHNGKEYLCMNYGWLAFDGGSPLEMLAFMETYPSFVEGEPEPSYLTIWGNQGSSVGNSYVVETPVYITISKDTKVNVTFGTWFIDNTDYNEINSAQ